MRNPDYPPPKAGEPALHRAARTGEHAELEALVAAGADLEETFDLALDPGGRPMFATPLMVAAGSADGATVETVRLLLRLGSNAVRSLGKASAAHFAVGGLGWNYEPGGDVGRLRVLLDAGCDVHEVDPRGVTLLAEAAGTGDDQRVALLLERGANVLAPNAGEHRFQLPLFAAAGSGSARCVTLLLAAGADTTILDGQSRTAMFHAANESVMRVLLAAGLSLDARDTYEWPPLVAAIADGEAERVAAYLAVGADPNATYDRGFTPFMSAVSGMERQVRVMRMLVDAGANPRAVTELGWTAFHAAIDVSGQANAEASVRSTLGLLKELGVDLDQADLGGETPLMRASRWGTEMERRVLLELGARSP
jgi:ankyrin repeat protein